MIKVNFKVIIKHSVVSMLLAVVIYIVSLAEIALFLSIVNSLQFQGFLFALLINFIVQIAVIAIPTIIAAIKFEYHLKYVWITVLMLFILFSIYHIPSFYLIMFTGGYQFFGNERSVSLAESAMYISSQYAVILLFICLIMRAVQKAKHTRSVEEEK